MAAPRIARLVALAFTFALPAAAAAQGTATDAAGDFLTTYAGVRTLDLDVLGVSFTFDGANFRLRSTQAGAIDPASGHLFVWGINRGTGTAGFASLGLGGVLFDAVLAINPGSATNSVRLLPEAATLTLPGGSVLFSGNVLEIVVPAALLPSRGFALTQYTANLWPRDGVSPGTSAISDFAPDNGNVGVLATPEPATALLVAPLGLGLIAWRRRRRV